MISSTQSNNIDPLLKDKSDHASHRDILIDLDQYYYLTDHVFQNVPVLPGTFYIDLALSEYYKMYSKYPGVMRNLKFLQPVILGKNQINIDLAVYSETSENNKFQFIENHPFVIKKPSDKPSAELEISNSPDIKTNSSHVYDLSEFKKAADDLDPEVFYSKLSENGNQYGSNFRNLQNIKIKGNKAIAHLKNIFPNTGSEKHILHPALLDSALHLTSALTHSYEKTFVLDSIKEIIFYKNDLKEDVWCLAELKSAPTKFDGFEGNVDIVNSSGELYVRLSGVSFKYPEQFSDDLKIRKKISLAGSFTIDPIKDSLRFWNHYFKYPFEFAFASYNQIFQQMLDSSGVFKINNEGINVILLNLEDWLNKKTEKLKPIVSADESSSLLKNERVYTLPNDCEVVHLNKYETDYLYKEIFIDNIYLREGITINDGDTIIDIGANIGLFTLFVNQQCRDPQVYSFEPSPGVFESLKINSRIYGRNTKVYNKGVSDKRRNITFTFYPNSTVFSGFAADEAEDKEALQQVIKNILGDDIQIDDSSLIQYADEISGGRLKKELYQCEVISVSDIIEENKIQKVDLLKIDAEKSELEILKGIKRSDWDKIRQIVIEIHDKKGNKLEKAKELLKEMNFRVSVIEENSLRKSGLFNLYAIKGNDNSKNQIPGEYKADLENKIEFFSDAVTAFANNFRGQLIIGLTPPSDESLSDSSINRSLKDAETKIVSKLSGLSNVHLIQTDEFLNSYRVKGYSDKYSFKLGHIPYSRDFYTSLGTTIIRKIISLSHNSYKVIVLDCDNTLWKGICGEIGYDGITITHNFSQLQNFMLDQMRSGKLICLCSKNNEEDVWNIFEHRDDMLIKRDHIVSSKLNWKPKSENIVSMSSELNLGLESFIFIDDNPVECAEVRYNCPSVLTLQLPQEEDNIPAFLSNVWAFDKGKVTEEDKKRTRMYKENILRSRYYNNFPSLKDFIDGLELNISTYEPRIEQLNRVSQLTFRTNQFNFTSIRRNEAEINSLLNNPNYKCAITEVNDRFGDYGIVGVLIYQIATGKLKVDTFLLSCRVLGKGVEHKMLSELGRTALRKNIKEIEVRYIPDQKNKPAFEFINTLHFLFRTEKNGIITFSFHPEYLLNLKYKPADNERDKLNPDHNPGNKFRQTVNERFGYEYFQKIADELCDINRLTAEVDEFNQDASDAEKKSIISPATEIEIKLAEIWKKILGKRQVSIDDNFFETGGSSLKAIQVIAAVKKEMNLDLSIISLFEYPTISSLANNLTAPGLESGTNPIDVIERGAKRKKIMYKRKRG